MSIIETLDNFDSSDELAPTQANFPALAHFWPCDEDVGSTTLTDSVGGVVCPLLSFAQTTGAEGNAVDVTQALNAIITDGTLTGPGAKNAIIMMMADLGSNGVTINIGNSGNTGGFTFNIGSSKHTSFGGGTADNTSGAAFGSAVEAHVMEWVPSASLTGYDLVTSGTVWATNGTADTTTVEATINTMNQATTFGWDGVGPLEKCYGIAMFYFETLPTDLESAITWMFAEWLQGNKVIYPGWKDRI